MPSPLFRFLEIIADELSSGNSKVITQSSLNIKGADAPLFEDLKKELKPASSDDTIKVAVEELKRHFESKNAKLPFSYDPATGRFTVVDKDFLSFLKDMNAIRGLGKRSRDFECDVAKWLGKRVTGAIHRVGSPRDIKKRRDEFNLHLRGLGFGRPVLLGKERDGGLDIIWLLPLGSLPHRPLVLVQCKNGEFNMDVAHASVGTSGISLSQHSGLQSLVHVPCVLFNDYVYPERLTSKQLNFVPLGLTDLATIQDLISVDLI